MGRIIAEHWLGADLKRVFAFFSDPRNLPKLMPGHLAVRLESLDLRQPAAAYLTKVVQSGMDPEEVAGPGTRITISFRLVPYLPFRARWVAEILDYQPLEFFLDSQEAGPMKRWIHRHSFRAETRNGITGTVVRDEVEYELPFGVFGSLADRVFVERLMNRVFKSRQEELERLLIGC